MPDSLAWLVVVLTVLTIANYTFDLIEKGKRVVEWLRKGKQKDRKPETPATASQESSRPPISR